VLESTSILNISNLRKWWPHTRKFQYYIQSLSAVFRHHRLTWTQQI